MSFQPFGGSSTVATITGLSDALSNRWHVVGSSEQALGGRGTIATAGTYNSFRIRHVNNTGKTITAIRLAYSNTYYSGLVETVNTNTITVKAAIEHTVTTTDTQTGPIDKAHWAGSLTTTITGGAMAISDPIPCNIAPGDVWYERVGVTVSTNGDYYPYGGSLCGGTSYGGENNGESKTLSSDLVHSGTFTANTGAPVFSASAVLGTVADGSAVKSIAIIGDSIVGGTDDAGYMNGAKGGWALRAFVDYPRVYVPLGSDTIASFSSRANGYNRWRIASMCSTVMLAFGRNELGTSVATTKASILAVAKWFMARGSRVIACTILPAPTSTDGWYTVTNQTPQAGASETNRVSLNSWITETSSSGFVAQAMAQVSGFANAGDAASCDPCAAVECNAAGALTVGGGRVLGSQSAKVVTGTLSSGAAGSVTDSTQSLSKNAYKGYAIYITGGTGSGQLRAIGWNSTVGEFGVASNFSPAPDNTSTYEVFNPIGFNGVHPVSGGFAVIAASLSPSSLIR